MRSSRRVHAQAIRTMVVNSAQSNSEGMQLENADVSQSEATAVGPILRKRSTSVQKLVHTVQNSQGFASAIRKHAPHVKCHILSLHGYSSLAMFEAKPRVFMNKVHGRVSFKPIYFIRTAKVVFRANIF